jgi:hypothetical protein
MAVNRVQLHPRPKGPQVSILVLAIPHSLRVLTVHSAADLICGEPVNLGPFHRLRIRSESLELDPVDGRKVNLFLCTDLNRKRDAERYSHPYKRFPHEGE